MKDDRFQIRAVVSHWIADPNVDVILTTGGTGFTGRDSTPEAIAPLLEKTIDGFGELFRQVSFEEIGYVDHSIARARRLEQRHAGVLHAGFEECVQTAWKRILHTSST